MTDDQATRHILVGKAANAIRQALRERKRSYEAQHGKPPDHIEITVAELEILSFADGVRNQLAPETFEPGSKAGTFMGGEGCRRVAPASPTPASAQPVWNRCSRRNPKASRARCAKRRKSRRRLSATTSTGRRSPSPGMTTTEVRLDEARREPRRDCAARLPALASRQGQLPAKR